MTNLNTPSTNVIKGTGEVYYADAGTKPPPGINLPPVGEIVVKYKTSAPATADNPTDRGDPVVLHTYVSSAHSLYVWQAGRWVELTNVDYYDGSAKRSGAQGAGYYWGYSASTDTPYGWRLTSVGSASNGETYTGKASGWTTVGAISKSGIDFGASPASAFIYEANSHFPFDAHDVAVDDMFSIALLQSTLSNIYHLVHGETVATFNEGKAGSSGSLINLRYLRDGGPEKTKRGIAILHDGFGASNKPEVNDPVRRRLWLPRCVNGGSPPRTMRDDGEQALVLPMKILKSFATDSIPNLGVGTVGLTSDLRYLNNEQPPIEYWEDIYS